MTTKTELTQEQTLELISRNLDNDLNKEERSMLFQHLSHSPESQTHMEAMAAVELNLTALSKEYESSSLDHDFNAKLMNAISQTQVASASTSWSWDRMKGWWGFLNPMTQSRWFPAALGVMGGFALFFFMGPQLLPLEGETTPRFSVAEIPFQEAQDMVQWNHEETVPPGQFVVFKVNENDHSSYHFRMASNTPVQVLIRHDNQSTPLPPPQQNLVINGIRYATLKAPRANDSVLIRNNGAQPLKVNAATNRPQTMNVSLQPLKLQK